MNAVLLLVGLVALFAGGESLVRGAVGIARRLAVPPLLIGLTVVGFGTSTPELLVSVDAALRNAPDIALGNVVGSNIANILLIVGLAALVRPIRVAGATLPRDTAAMLAAAVVLIPLFWLGSLGRGAGAVLLVGLVAYVLWAYLAPADGEASTDPAPVMKLGHALVWLTVGLAGLMLGARFMVDGAVGIARSLNISEAFIGLTVVAVGTSLPELATSLIAAFRRQSEIAIGNVVGSNIFNVLGILGATALIAPIPVATRFLTFDLPIMIAVSAVLTALLLLRPRIGRGAGLALLVAYTAYVVAARG